MQLRLDEENLDEGMGVMEVCVPSTDTGRHKAEAACPKHGGGDAQDLLARPRTTETVSLGTDPAVRGQNGLTCADPDSTAACPTG